MSPLWSKRTLAGIAILTVLSSFIIVGGEPISAEEIDYIIDPKDGGGDRSPIRRRPSSRSTGNTSLHSGPPSIMRNLVRQSRSSQIRGSGAVNMCTMWMD